MNYRWIHIDIFELTCSFNSPQLFIWTNRNEIICDRKSRLWFINWQFCFNKEIVICNLQFFPWKLDSIHMNRSWIKFNSVQKQNNSPDRKNIFPKTQKFSILTKLFWIQCHFMFGLTSHSIFTRSRFKN